MTRKRFIKQLQAVNVQRDAAAWYVKICQRNHLEYAKMVETIRCSTIGKCGASKIERKRNGALHVKMWRLPE